MVLVSFLRMMNISFPNCSLSININIVKKGDFMCCGRSSGKSKTKGKSGVVKKKPIKQENKEEKK